ncbi:hypothetical protein Gotur_029343 [Gossypium turneri]
MPRTVSTIRIHHELTPSKLSGDAAAVNRNMLAADHHNVAVPPHGSHGIVIGVLKKGRITPSGPSHRGNTIPIYTTRHDGCLGEYCEFISSLSFFLKFPGKSI